MNRTNKVNIFLAIVTTIAIIIAIFAMNRSVPSEYPLYTPEDYERNIKVLNDTIQELKRDIAIYETEIDRIEFERIKIKKELELIIKDNEKIDNELSNGDWDYNIHFLTDYLSEKDSVGD